MKRYTLDATNNKLGRIASKAASIIMGKNLASFKRNEIPDVEVLIENANKVDMPERKLSSKTYQRYSGYPGGRKVLSAAQMIAKKGYRELFRICSQTEN